MLSHELPDAPLADAVASGAERFRSSGPLTAARLAEWRQAEPVPESVPFLLQQVIRRSKPEGIPGDVNPLGAGAAFLPPVLWPHLP